MERQQTGLLSQSCGWVCLWLPLLWLGCARVEVDYREVIRPDEIVHSAEWQAFRRIVAKLPSSRMQQFPDQSQPLPQWHQARTLPVDELAAEERALLDRSWDPQRLAREFWPRNATDNPFDGEQLTAEQFAGLTLTLETALRRASLPEDFPLESVIARGKAAIQHLSQDKRLYSSLSLEDRHRVLDEAAWLHYLHEAQTLQSVPEVNIGLVQRNAKWLREILPARSFTPPLQAAAELLREEGLPFIEQPESGLDAEIEWSSSDALVGKASDGTP